MIFKILFQTYFNGTEIAILFKLEKEKGEEYERISVIRN